MIRPARLSLIELLDMSNPDVNQIISTFVTHFNKAYGHPGMDRWDVTKEDWQRYEFLGDRVINLIVAQILFTRRNSILDEGEMTKILSSVVSNESLSALATRIDPLGFARLVPALTAEQNTYGKRIAGGAFEAFIGALYCEVGLDDVAYFLNTTMAESLDHYDPQSNAIGVLQEHFQKLNKSMPSYRETNRTGPDHKPVFTYQVLVDNEVIGEGNGDTIQQAQQAAAKQALVKLGLLGSIPGR
jgi:ribonuclease-3